MCSKFVEKVRFPISSDVEKWVFYGSVVKNHTFGVDDIFIEKCSLGPAFGRVLVSKMLPGMAFGAS